MHFHHFWVLLSANFSCNLFMPFVTNDIPHQEKYQQECIHTDAIIIQYEIYSSLEYIFFLDLYSMYIRLSCRILFPIFIAEVNA